MCCLYCGKEIGAFRLLRDSEFCSALHRKKYGERLGKALHDIAAPEAAPAGVAGFLVQMPFQQGNRSSTLILWQTVTGRKRIRTGAQWPLTIDISDDKSGGQRTRSGSRMPRQSNVRRRCERWMPAPAPEPVAAFVQASAAPTPATPCVHADSPPHSPAAGGCGTARTGALRPLDARSGTRTRRRFRTQPPRPRHLLRRRTCARAFAAGLRAVPLGWTARATARARHAMRPLDARSGTRNPSPLSYKLPRAGTRACACACPVFAVEPEAASPLDSMLDPPPVCERWMPGPAPEPVAAFVQACRQADPGAGWRSALRLVARTSARVASECEPRRHATSGCRVSRCGAGCQSDMCHRTAVRAGAWNGPAAPPRMPAPEFTADLESLPALDDLLEPPAMCQQWMPAPAADPVFSHLQASVAPAVIAPVALKAPAFDLVTRRPACAVDRPVAPSCRSRNRSWTPCGQLRRKRRWF